jgi:hypothetical protein
MASEAHVEVVCPVSPTTTVLGQPATAATPDPMSTVVIYILSFSIITEKEFFNTLKMNSSSK